MVKLEGTEKQVKWATDIKEDFITKIDSLIASLENNNLITLKGLVTSLKSQIMGRIKEKSNEEARRVLLEILPEVKQNIENETSAKKIIDTMQLINIKGLPFRDIIKEFI